MFVANTYNTNIQQVDFTIAYLTFVSPYLHSCSLHPHFTQFSPSAVAFTNELSRAIKRNEPKSAERARVKEKITENLQNDYGIDIHF